MTTEESGPSTKSPKKPASKAGVAEIEAEGPQPDEVEGEEPSLRSELDLSRKEREELFRKLQYLQADFENFRKRSARETETVLRFAHEALVARLLPVLDDFDATLAHVGDDASKGVRMVRDNLLKALQEAGLQEIPASGEKFDPYVHECLQQVPDEDLEDGTVKEVVRKGYRFREHVLRPAQVIVVQNRGEPNG